METDSGSSTAFEVEVAGRFGILPNFFRSARAAPELLEQLWGFAKAGYLDNPMPAVFKERLFVWLSRFCPMRYCIVRHVGFLLGGGHGRAAGDANAKPQSLTEVIALLRRPSPWHRDMAPVYASLEAQAGALKSWPAPGSEMEDAIFACAAVMFIEPARSDSARRGLVRILGLREYELFSGCLAFIRTAHYWTMLHPEIESEDDMIELMRGHADLARLLLEDPEAHRSEMSERTFQELTHLRDLNERQELQKAKQALEEKDRQKDQFIAVLAHELRNPLSAIRTSAYALRRLDLQDDRAAPLVERVDRQSTAIARMLDDLLDASRIAFGKVSVQLEPLELRALLTEAFDEQEPHARQAGLQLNARIAGGICIVNADRVRLRQIIDNLLSNAIKFTPAGGGLGLGLAIAALLARLQNAALTASSAGVGQGAVFTLSMPVAPSPDDSPVAAASLKQFRPRSVLLVEDNKDLADVVAELLRLHGVIVRVGYDGHSAVKSSLETVPDIILCDLGLPGGMDGFAVARACRAEASLRKVRLVAASGYSSAEDHANAITAGFDSLMIKPLTEECLRTLIR